MRDTKQQSPAKIVQEEQERTKLGKTSLSQTRLSDRNCTVVGQKKKKNEKRKEDAYENRQREILQKIY